MKIALIGYGYWGPNLAKNINGMDGIEFAGICERDILRLNKAKKVYGDKLAYTEDYRRFLDDFEVDAIAIATPTEASFQIAMDALEAGKDIFIEKPIASTVERAEKIREMARKKGAIVHCDHIMLYHPVIRYIKSMMDRDELGNLLYIDVSRVNLGPIRKDVNVLLDLAVHDLAVIDFLSNGERAQDISAMGQICFGRQESVTYLTIKYESFIAHIKSSWVSPIKERKTVVAGTKKMVVFDDMAMDKLTIYDRGIDIEMAEEYGDYEYHVRTGDIYIPKIIQEDALRNSLKHFMECVNSRKESLSGPAHSLKVMEILEKATAQLKEKHG